MSKHTKGEWAVSDDGYGARIEPSIAWIGYGSAHSKAEHQANALLIAAAPELLDAAQAARAILQACGEWGNPFISPQVKIIEDAIKKATGGE